MSVFFNPVVGSGTSEVNPGGGGRRGGGRGGGRRGGGRRGGGSRGGGAVAF